MKHLSFKKVEHLEIVCEHPKVSKVWQWGGMSINPTSGMKHWVSVLLIDETRKDFEIKNNDMSEVDKFIDNL